MSADQDIQDRFLVSFTPQDCRPRVADAACYLGGAGYRPTPGIRRRIEKALNLAEGLMAGDIFAIHVSTPLTDASLKLLA